MDEDVQAAVASLVLALWRRRELACEENVTDLFLVVDPSDRFPPQFDMVSAVAPIVFRGGIAGEGSNRKGLFLPCARPG